MLATSASCSGFFVGRPRRPDESLGFSIRDSEAMGRPRRGGRSSSRIAGAASPGRRTVPSGQRIGRLASRVVPRFLRGDGAIGRHRRGGPACSDERSIGRVGHCGEALGRGGAGGESGLRLIDGARHFAPLENLVGTFSVKDTRHGAWDNSQIFWRWRDRPETLKESLSSLDRATEAGSSALLVLVLP